MFCINVRHNEAISIEIAEPFVEVFARLQLYNPHSNIPLLIPLSAHMLTLESVCYTILAISRTPKRSKPRDPEQREPWVFQTVSGAVH